MSEHPMVPDFQKEQAALAEYTAMSEAERDKWLHMNVFGAESPVPHESFDSWWERYYLTSGHYHSQYAQSVVLLEKISDRAQKLEHIHTQPVRMFRHDSGAWQVELHIDDGAHGYGLEKTFQEAVCMAVAKTVINRKLLKEEGKAWRYGVLFWLSEIEGIPSRQVQTMADERRIAAIRGRNEA